METLIRKLRLTQDYGHTTVGADYAKEMVAAGHALAMNAKNLLDTVDNARIICSNAPSSTTMTTTMTTTTDDVRMDDHFQGGTAFSNDDFTSTTLRIDED